MYEQDYLLDAGKSICYSFLAMRLTSLWLQLRTQVALHVATSLRNGTFSNGRPVFCFLDVFFRGAFMALLEMLQKYSTDEKCREILTKLRWPEGVRCPRCKEDRVCYLESRKQFECASCSYQFSVLTGTVFNDTHLPLRKVVCCYLPALRGQERHLRLPDSAHARNQLQDRMVSLPQNPRSNERSQQNNAGRQDRNGRNLCGRSRSEGAEGIHWTLHQKEIVIGIRQRDGELRLFHAKDVKAGTIYPATSARM